VPQGFPMSPVRDLDPAPPALRSSNADNPPAGATGPTDPPTHTAAPATGAPNVALSFVTFVVTKHTAR
jgi:hypothetical protein